MRVCGEVNDWELVDLRHSLMEEFENCRDFLGLEAGGMTTLARDRKHGFLLKAKVQLVLLVWSFLVVTFWFFVGSNSFIPQRGRVL